MALEIERKFLLANDKWRHAVLRSAVIRQGYLNTAPERAVRVRIKGDQGWLTIKGRGDGISRPEYEYEIPLEDAQSLLDLCEQPIIEKIRHEVKVGNHLWEIDEFSGVNGGLELAEVELSVEDEVFLLPVWLGREVTHQTQYSNISLIKHPFKKWLQPGFSK